MRTGTYRFSARLDGAWFGWDHTWVPNQQARTLRRKKFDGGRRTPQEYHREFGFPPGACCAACGKPPAVRAIVLAPFDEVNKRGMLPPGATLNPSILQSIVPLKNASGQPEPYVRLSIAYSCSSCQKSFEKELAKAPSWCVIELNRGPDPTNKVVSGYG